MDPSKKNHSEPSRLQWKINHYIGLGLIFLIFFAVNYIGGKRYLRENLATSNYAKVSDLSINLIQSLNEPVEIINYTSPQDDPLSALIIQDVNRLLDEYDHYGADMVKVKNVDPYLHYDAAREIADEFKVALQESVILIKQGEQNTVINYRDLADIAEGGTVYDPVPPRVLAFKAEQQITSAIQALSDPEQSVMYFITGHGEYDTAADFRNKQGLSKLATYIERQNIEIRKINLIEEGQIPDDANMVVIAGPKAPYAEHEIAMLQAYIQRNDDRAGRLLLMLDPQTDTGLETLLQERGVTFRNDMALTHVMILGQVRTMEDAIITRVANHPVTEWMQGRQLNMGIGKSRTLQIAPATEGAAPAAKALLMTPESYWGETEPDLEEVRPTDGVDARGPLTVAVLIDEGSLSDGQVNLQSDRIVAIGSSEFLTNQSLQGNQLDLFLNISNWMLDKDSSLGISPKVLEEFYLTLDDRQKQILSGVMVLLIPFLGLLAGLLVWLRRKK
ncbi:MAG: GldG family protein [Gammaproteobacteria bacterium]|nr:GldG family protein [Gammaproteobacteria bacterium]